MWCDPLRRSKRFIPTARFATYADGRVSEHRALHLLRHGHHHLLRQLIVDCHDLRGQPRSGTRRATSPTRPKPLRATRTDMTTSFLWGHLFRERTPRALRKSWTACDRATYLLRFAVLLGCVEAIAAARRRQGSRRHPTAHRALRGQVEKSSRRSVPGAGRQPTMTRRPVRLEPAGVRRPAAVCPPYRSGAGAPISGSAGSS
jgi:hypothetical protein